VLAVVRNQLEIDRHKNVLPDYGFTAPEWQAAVLRTLPKDEDQMRSFVAEMQSLCQKES
jgi:hypothetical protein